MKTIIIDVNAINTDAKIIGNIDLPKNTPLCIVSEKNILKILKTLGSVPVSDMANKIAQRLRNEAVNPDFTAITLQSIMTEEMENIQFVLDCGELLIGDDSKIKEFIGDKYENIHNK